MNKALLTCFLLCSVAVDAQVPSDSAQFNHAFKNLQSVYQKGLENNSNLYNGSEYIGYPRGMIGHQFFISDQFLNGSIMYENVLYENVPLLYDVVKDEVVINLYKRDFRIKLLNEKIAHFTIGPRYFERIGKGGFFEVIHSNSILVIAKRTKRIITSLNTEEPSRFIPLDRYFFCEE